MTSDASVTLVVPTWNAGPEFPAILETMRRQEMDRPFEILVIDSGSKDGTAEFLRSQPVRLIEIPKSAFDHGLTRNLGVQEARGEIVVLTTQDARPADQEWMRWLVDCFRDGAVAGAYSRQLPRADADPFTRDRLNRWSAGRESRRVQRITDRREFDALDPLQKLERVAFDNVSSSVRRRVALEIPFRARRFGEDLDWALRVLLSGYEIVFEPRSRVVHSHDNSAWRELRRIYLDHQNLDRLFGLRTVPRWRDVIRNTVGGGWRLFDLAQRDPALGVLRRVRGCARALPYSFAQNLGQFLGARSAERLRVGNTWYALLDRWLGGEF